MHVSASPRGKRHLLIITNVDTSPLIKYIQRRLRDFNNQSTSKAHRKQKIKKKSLDTFESVGESCLHHQICTLLEIILYLTEDGGLRFFRDPLLTKFTSANE